MVEPIRRVVLEDVGSTNTEAFGRARSGDTGPLWVMARRQTQGRGRAGRQWVSEPGNLYASLLQRLACQPGSVHQISLVAGVAVMEAIATVAGTRPISGLRLKWPNDVLIGRAKCAGILPESTSGGSSSEVIAVIGVGINLAWHPPDLGRPATNLAAHGLTITPESMLAALAAAMERWLCNWRGGENFAAVRAAWLERAGPVGESVTVDTGREIIAGKFLDLDRDGALVLLDHHGVLRKVTFGEVTLAPPSLPRGLLMARAGRRDGHGTDELVFMALGGIGEIGMNCYLYGLGPVHARQWLMVDLGITFPEGENDPGVDVILPDLRFIEEERASLAGLVLTHGHEDHFGAVVELWPRLKVPIYATPFTAALLRAKLAEYGRGLKLPVHEVALNSRFNVGPFALELISVAHSIPEPNALAIRTPQGLVLHSGDWKIDPTPILGAPTDSERLMQLGREGVTALICGFHQCPARGPLALGA